MMELEVTNGMNAAWLTCKPIGTYETTYLYTGLGRIDTHAQKIQTLECLESGHIYFKERDFDGGVVSRVYTTERVRITEYSRVPRVWKEELSPTEIYFYRQCGSLTPRKT
jgi:hypothetical protein